jgi:hypothetical protein
MHFLTLIVFLILQEGDSAKRECAVAETRMSDGMQRVHLSIPGIIKALLSALFVLFFVYLGRLSFIWIQNNTHLSVQQKEWGFSYFNCL